MDAVHVVLFGRDLRINDHEPLIAAALTGQPVVCLYVFEPANLADGTYDAAHHRFVLQSMRALDDALAARGNRLTVLVGDVPAVFDRLRSQVPIAAIHTYERVGGLVTAARDKRLAWWCEDLGVQLHRYRDDGVRTANDGTEWRGHWDTVMRQPPFPAPARIRAAKVRGVDWPSAKSLGLAETTRGRDFEGGSPAGHEVLESWLGGRILGYERFGDLPSVAWERSSRLSPWLAWGCLSMRQVVHATDEALKARGDDLAWRRSLFIFRNRLTLRAEALQQLHDEPALQFRTMNRGLQDLRPKADEALLDAWEQGRTGYPLVDASMRCLRETGWLPYNLRKLVVQFACFHLWQPWREVAKRLGAMFIDFEPGIHYPQIQVLTGGTAQTSPRIPNPTKLAQELDPDGTFLRSWLPELDRVPDNHLFAPWRMGGSAQRRSSCRIGRTYPFPLVHHATVYKQAKRRLVAANQRDHVQEDEGRVATVHAQRPLHLATARSGTTG